MGCQKIIDLILTGRVWKKITYRFKAVAYGRSKLLVTGQVRPVYPTEI